MKIKILGNAYKELAAALEWDGKERAAFLLCNRSTSKNKKTLIVKKILSPAEDDYVIRTAGYCIVKKRFIDIVYNEAVKEQCDVIKVHTHSPDYPAIYSPIDEHHEPVFFRHLYSKIKGMIHASLVFSSPFDSVDGWYYAPEKDRLLPIEKVLIIGPESLDVLIPHRSPLKDTVLDPALDRTVLAFGEGRVRKFAALDIGIVGVGGTGSVVAELVARDRPRKLLICDPDTIEDSNLNRLVGATQEDIGKNKADFYAEYAKSISPDTEVIAFAESFYDPTVQKEFTQAELIIGCVDSGMRHSAGQLCMSHIIPYFDLGASIQSVNGSPEFIGGQVYSFIPGRDVCLACSGVFQNLLAEYLSPQARQADIERGYIKGEDVKSPLVAYLDFMIAGLGYYEVLKYVLGLPGKSSFKVHFDQINDRIVRSDCKTENCHVCREDGLLGTGDKAPLLLPQKDIDDAVLSSILKVSMAQEGSL